MSQARFGSILLLAVVLVLSGGVTACDSGGGDDGGEVTGGGGETGGVDDTGGMDDTGGGDETGGVDETGGGEDAGGADETGGGEDTGGADETGDDTVGDDTVGDDTGVGDTGGDDTGGGDTGGGDTGGGDTGGGDTGGGDTGVGDTSLDGPVCVESGFVSAFDTMEMQEDGTLVYASVDQTSYPLNNLRIEWRPGTPILPGSYDLTGNDPETCSVCPTLAAGCVGGSSGYLCEEEYFANAGTLEIESVPGIPVAQTVPTTKGPAGYPVAAEPAQETCVPEGTGNFIGHNVADFALMNCKGEWVKLHDSCGQHKAVWLMSVASWCTACTALLQEISSQIKQQIGGTGKIDQDSIQSLFPQTDYKVVLFENLYGDQPTLQTCKQYAASHNLDESMLFLDWGGNFKASLKDVAFTSESGAGDESWCVDGYDISGGMEASIPLVAPVGYAMAADGMATTWTYLNPYLAANAQGYIETFTPWQGILRGSNLEYIWSSFYQKDVFFVDPLYALLNE